MCQGRGGRMCQGRGGRMCQGRGGRMCQGRATRRGIYCTVSQIRLQEGASHDALSLEAPLQLEGVLAPSGAPSGAPPSASAERGSFCLEVEGIAHGVRRRMSLSSSFNVHKEFGSTLS